MFIPFFFQLRDAGIPVTLREFLLLLEAMKAGVPDNNVDSFYHLARTVLVKNEKYFDRFDQVFGHFFAGIEKVWDSVQKQIPESWLQSEIERLFTDEEREMIEALGGFEKLMEELQKRLEEQDGEHHGGNKWIGTGGTSPFGSGGYNPEGVRIGDKGKRQGRATKVWDKREYRNLDDTLQLGNRNMKVALRQLRRLVREGIEDELDLDDTIRSTAKNAGFLDVKMRPERHNRVKVLILFDIGGSMDYHIRHCEELFSAARSEFKNLEFFYFHNFIYERLWKDNRRRHEVRMTTPELMRHYSADYRVIIVGDATMSPYEITHAGGSVEHMNEEPGAVWLQRLRHLYSHLVWLNPEPKEFWERTPSIQITRQLMDDKMYPMTVNGLEQAVKALRR
ncbi:MAG: VWA domain-containing protein [Immundisolibacteraceae bacterium]|nr:VWA domain-containing protein [Immundisolibacteraceae bacterium]